MIQINKFRHISWKEPELFFKQIRLGLWVPQDELYNNTSLWVGECDNAAEKWHQYFYIVIGLTVFLYGLNFQAGYLIVFALQDPVANPAWLMAANDQKSIRMSMNTCDPLPIIACKR